MSNHKENFDSDFTFDDIREDLLGRGVKSIQNHKSEEVIDVINGNNDPQMCGPDNGDDL